MNKLSNPQYNKDSNIDVNVEKKDPVIKIMGLGGGGGNSAETLYDISNIKEKETVSFLHINTDRDACIRNKLDYLLIGDKESPHYGYGSGGNPAVALECVQHSVKDIENELEGVDVLFLSACLGGGTGTGTVEFIANLAKQRGVLTICMVTVPFEVDGIPAMKSAQEVLNKLYKVADSVIAVPNQKAVEIFPLDTEMDDVYKAIDMILARAVDGIADLLLNVNRVNIDFGDVRSAIVNSGPAVIAMGESSGKDKIVNALNQALDNPLTDHKVGFVKSILINVCYGDSFKIQEFLSISNSITKYKGPNTSVFVGQGKNSDLKDKVRITVVLAGLGSESL